MKRGLALVGAWIACISASPAPVALDLVLGSGFPERLSDFRFFTSSPARATIFGSGAQTNARVTFYSVNAELFSDYAEKRRFFFLPPGKKLTYMPEGVFDFPVGSALIKNFGLVTRPASHVPGLRLIETRVLLRRASGWVALPYVWNEDGSDALLARAGKRLTIAANPQDRRGEATSYVVPNVNQCKGCHESGAGLTPIGPKARNLNDWRQMQAWTSAGLLDRVPRDAPYMPGFHDSTAPLEARARAYLDINCGHCHNRDGAANTSGLWLDWNQPLGVNYGVRKRPVAAGRGSGDLDYVIDPGHPERSILVFRMQSLDPGIAMPELGRQSVHREGVALVSQWIKSLN